MTELAKYADIQLYMIRYLRATVIEKNKCKGKMDENKNNQWYFSGDRCRSKICWRLVTSADMFHGIKTNKNRTVESIVTIFRSEFKK